MGAGVLIIAAWFAGGIRSASQLQPALRQAMPAAETFARRGSTLYAGYGDRARRNLLGYVAIGTADGYGGPLRLAVAVDTKGRITGLAEVSNKETPDWNDLVARSSLPSSLMGKSASDKFQLGVDVDGVSGATFTSRAMAEAALDGSEQAARVLGLPFRRPPPPHIRFGLPEITVLALFALAIVSGRPWFKYKKQGRWLSMLVGLAVLGFLYNLPLTLAFVTKLVLGYWPQWQTNLYWYFLLGGTLFVILVERKNLYCDRICPFGAAQECMGATGGAKVRTPPRHRTWLKWLPRILALVAILLGVFLRSPGVASYELFGTLFDFRGSGIQFLALGLVLLGSLFLLHPWCRYLCPVRPILDWIRIMREGVVDLWQRAFGRAPAA